ncbi:MAG: hypothetical protein ACT4QC_12670 [Planctomycetaceae bacterium]
MPDPEKAWRRIQYLDKHTFNESDVHMLATHAVALDNLVANLRAELDALRQRVEKLEMGSRLR